MNAKVLRFMAGVKHPITLSDDPMPNAQLVVEHMRTLLAKAGYPYARVWIDIPDMIIAGVPRDVVRRAEAALNPDAKGRP